MKKILFGLALSLSTLGFAQHYPHNNWDNNGYYDDDDYYDDNDDQGYFPDDYYYNYPTDYYPNDYYQGYYNDYRGSIININWNNFFAQVSLAPWQIREIIYLNRLYSDFASWNRFYRYNPDRWYYDRFYALERIMGPRVFIIFQNNYYHGRPPIVYFQNYRRTYYSAPRFAVIPRYRNVNINIYRVNRSDFRQKNPTIVVANRAKRNFNEGRRNDTGFRNPNTGGNRVEPRRSNEAPRTNNGGFRSNENRGDSPRSNNSGIRSNDNRGNSPRANNSGFRGSDNAPRQAPRNVESPRGQREDRVNRGFKNNNGNRNSSPNMRNDNQRPSRDNNSHGRGNSGFKSKLANN